VAGQARRSPGCTPWAGAGERWPGPRRWWQAAPRPEGGRRGYYLSASSRPRHRGARPPPPSGGSRGGGPPVRGDPRPAPASRCPAAPGTLLRWPNGYKGNGPMQKPCSWALFGSKTAWLWGFCRPRKLRVFVRKRLGYGVFRGWGRLRVGNRCSPPLFPFGSRARSRVGARARARAWAGTGRHGGGPDTKALHTGTFSLRCTARNVAITGGKPTDSRGNAPEPF
jgi:hypothetical protein